MGYYSLPAPKGFVNDYAGLFSSEEKEQLEKKISVFEQETRHEIAVVIIKSLEQDTIENFAVKLFEDWGIGKKQADNGVLVLIALDERKMRIEVGYGLEGSLTDAESFWIINEVMRPAFQKGEYYEGVSKAVDKIIEAVKSEEIIIQNQKPALGIEEFFLIGAIPLLCLQGILSRTKSWWLGGLVGAGLGLIAILIFGFLYTGLIALLLYTAFGFLFDFYVSKTYKQRKSRAQPMPWWLGGGRGSGFGGGGFGGFSGGSSGGGGSSGSW